jgi:hypothetical protein
LRYGGGSVRAAPRVVWVPSLKDIGELVFQYSSASLIIVITCYHNNLINLFVPKPPAHIDQHSTDLVPKLNNFIAELTNNPRIKRFSVQVNKKSGLVRVNAQSTDGRTVTKELLGPGLEATTRYEPSGKADRDRNIRILLAKDMTQQEVATRLGVSQALVSKVSRSKGT